MKKKFLNKIKDAKLLSRDESRTISGGYADACILPTCHTTIYALPPNCRCYSRQVYFGTVFGTQRLCL